MAASLNTATNGKLEFTTKKNAVKREVVGHGTSINALLSSKSVLVCRVLYLRKQGADPYQKLANFKKEGCWVNITPTHISRTLKDAVRFLGPTLGFTIRDVSIRSLRTAGEMALL